MSPTPNSQENRLGAGSWKSGVAPDYFDSASGLTWNLMILAT
jgi:hypothetical protein